MLTVRWILFDSEFDSTPLLYLSAIKLINCRANRPFDVKYLNEDVLVSEQYTWLWWRCAGMHDNEINSGLSPDQANARSRWHWVQPFGCLSHYWTLWRRSWVQCRQQSCQLFCWLLVCHWCMLQPQTVETADRLPETYTNILNKNELDWH